MKKCPKCGREYDNSMMFCLDDGTELLYGPGSISGSVDEPQTAILPDAAGVYEAATRAQIRDADRTAVLPSGTIATPKSFDKRLLFVPIVLAIVALGGSFGYRYFATANTSQINSIAVLPFDNRSGSGDADYLSDGLADSLIYRLSQLPDLKVSPTSSVMRYKGKETDVAQVAKELIVDAVMSGRLVQRGDDLSISVQLIDSRTQKIIWAEQYDRKMAELLATQREIATTITQKLQLKLSGDEAKGITKQYTQNNEAYQLYLKGRFYWNKRTPEGITSAIEQFKAAADKDPNFALAYVGLADSHLVGIYNKSESEKDHIAMAKAYAMRALEIDPTLAEPYASLGLASTYLWEWAEAEKYFQRAIEINPGYPSARHWYSRALRATGRTDEALEQIKRARDLDELSAHISNNVAESLAEKGDLQGAIDECRRGLGIAQTWPIYRTLAYSQLRMGLKDEALANARKAGEVSGSVGSRVSHIEGYVQAELGNRSEALRIAKEVEADHSRGQANGSDIAAIYAGLGETDKAFEWLEKDFELHKVSLVELRMEVPLIKLRNDPRYKDLLTRMGQTEERSASR